jgi:phospholipid transport system substrate-binding protein
VKKMNILGLLTLIFLLMQIAIPLLPAATHPAIEVVENLHTSLLSAMKDGDRIGYKGRYERLSPVIRSSFDLASIARVAVGRYWESFNDEQKAKFVETFTRLSIATYTWNFDAYSGERFKVISEKEQGGSQILVRTELTKSDGGKVQLDYLLHLVNNQWRIINVIADGVSDLALKRADYSNFLKNKGFEALLSKLNEKIAQYSNKSTD